MHFKGWFRVLVQTDSVSGRNREEKRLRHVQEVMKHAPDVVFWSLVGGGLALFVASVFGRCLEDKDVRRARSEASRRVYRARQEVKTLVRAVGLYLEYDGRLPDALGDLTPPDPKLHNEPYITDVEYVSRFIGPWNRPYLYGTDDDGSWFVQSKGRMESPAERLRTRIRGARVPDRKRNRTPCTCADISRNRPGPLPQRRS